MKRFLSRFALLAVAALFVGVASADEEVLYYLYFDIADQVTLDNGKTLSSDDYQYTMVALSDDGVAARDYIQLQGGGATQDGWALTSGSTEPVYAVLGSSYSAEDRILFELLIESPPGSTSWERVAYQSARLGDLISHIVSGNNMSATPYLVDHAAVPEPTSGLLMVLGFAGLALRRKRI